ncbi:dTDP-4-amino-4,6-dideoxygalactose transaminase [Ruminococcaceae bacterium P7]|nr:dTDP-4-amino-4,6-dideoxygalactose transaminase [Ruminococcaceae bacterium P7]
MSILVTRSSMPPFEEYCEEIKELWNTRWITNNGEKHQLFQSQLKEYLHTPNVTLYTNGHLALENVIEAMCFPKGGEVITTPFTFASTTHAIVRSGLTPVFCDIKFDDYTIDESKIEALITEKTCAIIPVHVYGNVCNIEAIQQIAEKYAVKVIYDAAHSFGVTYKEVSTANFGNASMFSFHATKVFNTIEGGAVCYSDSSLVQTLNDIKNFGIHGPEKTLYVGGNAKMNEFQAAMGICNLRHLDEEIRKRKLVAERYRQQLSDIDDIKLIAEQENVQSNYAYFPVVFEDPLLTRDKVFDLLREQSIFARKYFYPLTSEFECYQMLSNADSSKTPIAKYISEHILCLPIYADLSLEDVDKICEIISGFHRKCG